MDGYHGNKINGKKLYGSKKHKNENEKRNFLGKILKEKR
jgi:hypothetical protein